ncbi:MAG: hypothetical protein Rsou_1715 [Candidatus Ruthia sp. Asou_11_S2]|nr:hypothetical protein [Candidatus Ruthia sp. Asou_11_S2]
MATNNKKADNTNIQNSEPMKPEYEIYVDGAMSISLRSGMAKIDFYQALGMIDGNRARAKRDAQSLEKVLKAIKDSDTVQKPNTN